MVAFLVRRLLSVVAVMVGVAALVFSVFYAFRPEQISDGSGYPHQLLHFLDRAFLHFDLGTSWDRQLSFQPIAPLLRHSFPADLSLVAGGIIVGAALGVALGAVAAQRRGTLVARGLDGFAAFGMSAPVYWVGAMFIVFFHPEVGKFARLPISEPNTYKPLTQDPLAWLKALWMPWVLVGLPLAAAVLRMTESTLRDVQDEDFMRTARAKGISEAAVLRRHALPLAAAPVAALTGANMAILVTNVALMESAFNVPGIFREIRSVYSFADFPLIQGMVIEATALIVIANTLADTVLARLDPRVR